MLLQGSGNTLFNRLNLFAYLLEAAQRVPALLAPGLLLQGSGNTIIRRLNLFAPRIKLNECPHFSLPGCSYKVVGMCEYYP